MLSNTTTKRSGLTARQWRHAFRTLKLELAHNLHLQLFLILVGVLSVVVLSVLLWPVASGRRVAPQNYKLVRACACLSVVRCGAFM